MKELKKLLYVIFAWFAIQPFAYSAISFPRINIDTVTANTPQEFTQGVQILVMLTILSLAPSIFIMTKDDFLQLKELQRNSGLTLMKFLQERGLSYSIYNYRMLTMLKCIRYNIFKKF